MVNCTSNGNADDSILGGSSYFVGFFSGSIIIALASLVGHLIYGSTLGVIYKPQLVTATASV